MFAPFPLEFYLNYKVSTEIQGLSKALNFYFKIQGFLRTFKVCANAVFFIPEIAVSVNLQHRKCLVHP